MIQSSGLPTLTNVHDCNGLKGLHDARMPWAEKAKVWGAVEEPCKSWENGVIGEIR